MIYLIGSGGHAKVVLDALLSGGSNPASISVHDGDARRAGCALLGVAITAPEIDMDLAGANVHVAIGAPEARRRLYAVAAAAGGSPITVEHRLAIVSPFAQVAEGSFLAAGAVVGPDAEIGFGTIVNHGAVVDHDCSVGAYCHIAPNATLGGGVTLGDSVLIGAGATILPGVRIGNSAVVGAGAVVLRHIGAGEQWSGVPAKKADLKK